MSHVLFYDGGCAFCSAVVRRVARMDRRGGICFAPLAGELAARHGLAAHAAAAGGTMVVLRESDGVLLTRSDAVIELGRVLGGAWRLAAMVARWLPRRGRDAIYQFIADRRHRLCRSAASCAVPDPELSRRLRD
jgi:predicted DCC family thiol-disulfide oxidoreductase YuxK